jgi:hypothetical protein
MRKMILVLLSGICILSIAIPAVGREPRTQTGTDSTLETAAGQMPGYPYAGGKGPGMGRGYQQATPGPGRGHPEYRGGNSAGPDMPADSMAVDQAAAAAATATDGEFYPAPGWQQYRGRRGYGLGYPYADQDAYPYRGRGAGYGPGRRGYGYGYPGYRGRGGTGYPGHRQYGNPPFYRADETE